MTNIKYFSHKLGGFALTALMLLGITFFSGAEAEAQQTQVRRQVIIVRPVRRVYRPYYSPFGWYNRGWYNRGWYDSSWYNPYGQYVFDNSEEAAEKGFKQGLKTGEEDGRKQKSFSYERSHYYKEAGFGNFGEVYRRNFARGYQGGHETGIARAREKEAAKLAKKRAESDE